MKKLAGSRQSYCKNYQAYFFWPTLYMHVFEQVWSSGELQMQRTSSDEELQQSHWLRGDKLKAILLNADGEVSILYNSLRNTQCWNC